MKEYGAFWDLPTLQAHLLADPFTNPGPANLNPAAVKGNLACCRVPAVALTPPPENGADRRRRVRAYPDPTEIHIGNVTGYENTWSSTSCLKPVA